MNTTRARNTVTVILSAASLAVGCRSGAKAPTDSSAAAKAMADMPGMNMGDTTKPATGAMSVIFTPSQIANGAVRWQAAFASSVSSVVEVPGQLVPNEDRTARLASPGEGRILSIEVSPGDRVAAGAPLVRLQSQQAGMAQADVAKAAADVTAKRAAATYARTARERAERLLALKAIPRQDLERAIADDEAARAALTQAAAELQRAQATRDQLGADAPNGIMILRSPMAGVVIARDATPGAVVQPGTPLITVTDPSTLWLTAAATEEAAGAVRVGTRLRFWIASVSDTMSARVQSVAGAFDPVSRSLPIRAVVANPAGRLRPEMFAKVWIEGVLSTPTVVVPDSAVQRIDQKPVVFVAIPDGKGGARFEQRGVVLGAASGGQVSILSGLKPGEQIVTHGAYAVKAQIAKGKMPKMEM